MTAEDDGLPPDSRLSGLFGIDIERDQPELLAPVPGGGDSESQRAGRRCAEDEVRRAADPQEPPEHRLPLALAGEGHPPPASGGIGYGLAQPAICGRAAVGPPLGEPGPEPLPLLGGEVGNAHGQRLAAELRPNGCVQALVLARCDDAIPIGAADAMATFEQPLEEVR